MAVLIEPKVDDTFLGETLENGLRFDGRGFTEYRPFSIRYADQNSSQVEIHLGDTKVLATTAAEIVKPPPSHPGEGRVFVQVDLTELCNNRSNSEESSELAQLLDVLLRKSRALDVEALCIISGSKVWSLRVDIRCLSNDGNLFDASAIAAVCSLRYLRLQAVEVRGTSVLVKSPMNANPLPLCLHHLPIVLTVSYVPKESSLAPLIDPTRPEEQHVKTRISFAINQFGELCGVHKPGGSPLSRFKINEALQIALERSKHILSEIQSSLGNEELKLPKGRLPINVYGGMYHDISSYL